MNFTNSSPKSIGKLCEGEALFNEETPILCVRIPAVCLYSISILIILITSSSHIFIIAYIPKYPAEKKSY